MRRAIGCFKAYDLRGRVPDELDEDIAWRVGRAFAAWRGARRVAIGRDVRASSDALAAALARGLNEGGADVADLGPLRYLRRSTSPRITPGWTAGS
jgi:phosphomannomutase